MPWKGLDVSTVLEVTQSFSVQTLAKSFGWSPKSVYNSLYAIRRGEEPPDSLPPFFYRPGSNRPIFVHVAEWVESQLARQNKVLGRPPSTTTPATPSPEQVFGKTRGRKTNKEKAVLARGGEA